MPKKIQKDIIHAKGVDIGFYTEDYQNECDRIPWFVGKSPQSEF